MRRGLMVPSGDGLPKIVAVSANTTRYSLSTVTLNALAGVQEGDLLVSVVHEGSNSNPTPPAGWVQVTASGGEQGVKASAKFVTADEPSTYTGWYSSSSSGATIALVAIRGLQVRALPTPTFNTIGALGTTAAPSATAPSITPTAKSCVLYLGATVGGTLYYFSAGPPGMESALIDTVEPYAASMCVALDTTVSPSGVATGSRTATANRTTQSRLLALTL